LILATRFRPSYSINLALRTSEGAGNAGCWLHPRALRAKEMHFCARKHQQVQPKQPASPARMVLRLIRALPGVPGLLATVALRTAPQDLIPGSGDQAHTISPSAGTHLVFARPRVHRIPPPTSVTIASRPSCGDGTRGYNHDFPKNGSGIFSHED